MLSLYIHRPFCDQKCKYCSFQVVPCDNLASSALEMMDEYMNSLKEEIKSWWEFLNPYSNWKPPLLKGELKGGFRQELKTLYFWWWTPNKMWINRMIEIIDHVDKYFDLENLWELSIELNPYPEKETLELIKAIQKKYKNFPRIRRSIGLQTFDPDILKESWRAYSFPAMVDFLRELREIKEMNTVFNFDFIAFGKINQSKKGNKYLRDEHKQKFFQEFVASGFADSFSLYTLELFNNSERWSKRNEEKMDSNELIYSQQYWSSDDVYEEFSRLKNIVMDAWYDRYELSNFAKISKDSIHNRVYRNMENYIWVGTSASSFINFSKGQFTNTKLITKLANKFWIELKDSSGLRFTNTDLIWNYLKWKYRDENKLEIMTKEDYLIEKFFLWLRTNTWVENILEFENILEKNRKEKIEKFIEQDLCILFDNKFLLIDKWMDLFNTLVTDLLKKI